MLSGYKTYITAAIAIIGFWGAFLTGEADLSTTIQVTVEAALAAFIRHGISST